MTAATSLWAQDPFNLYLEPLNIPEVSGLQSYAFGQDSNGRWLLVGGRIDGLHRRQPWASFDVSGNNTQLIVIDPVAKQKWSASLSSLPTSMQEQLSSTNMNFYQEGDYLYCIGGYGYSATQSDHTTFPYLTAIKVPDVINAIINNTSFTAYFRQITDTAFQVTGGRLRKIYDVYHLLGGQKFLGRYNPMGGPTFTQQYTNQIRRFQIQDNGATITVTHLPPFTDAARLHRRDYNAEPQILPNGEEGVTMFSGVFQTTADVPFLDAVTVDSSGYAVDSGFQQYYNHYHCASIPLYSAMHNEMHTVFFGGIAQYYDSAGVLVQDNNVPFVKTIARVTRDSTGQMAEYKLPIEMPALLGAGAEFIPASGVPHYPNGVVKLDELTADTTLLGYIYGGIESSAPNIFWINDGTQSIATSRIFKVYLIKDSLLTSTHQLNRHSRASLQMEIYPNPSDGYFTVRYHLQRPGQVSLYLRTVDGKILYHRTFSRQSAGPHIHTLRDLRLPRGTYFVTLTTPWETLTRKLIYKR